MPKVTLDKHSHKKQLISAEIAKGQTLYSLDDKKVAAKLHVHLKTYQRKKRRPEQFTYAELLEIGDLLKFSGEVKQEVY